MNNYIQKLSNLKILYLILIFYVADLSISSIFSFFLFSENSIDYSFENKFEEFFVVVVFAPIIETYLFQYLPIKYLDKEIKNSLFIIIICGLIFAIFHQYNHSYTLKAFISGMLYSTLFLILRIKTKKTILFVFICHCLYNLTGFVLNFFLE